MTNFYEFASNSPFLTFFLALIIGETISASFKAVFKRNCSCKKVKDEQKES